MKKTMKVPQGSLRHLFIAALIAFAIPFILVPFVIQKSNSSSFMGMLISFTPLFTIVVSVPMLRVHPTKREVVGVLGGLFCLLLIFKDGFDKNIKLETLLLASSIPILYAFANTYIKMRLTHLHPVPLAFFMLSISATLLIPINLAIGKIQVDEHLLVAVGAIIILGFTTGAGHVAFCHLLQKHGPLRAGMICYLIPIVALFWGWVFGEPLSIIQILAILGVLIMAGIVQLGGKK